MKQFKILSLVLLAFALAAPLPQALAQTKAEKKKQKEEEKKWKKRMKDMEPLKFKQMHEEYDELKEVSAGYPRQLEAIKSQLKEFDGQMGTKSNTISSLEGKIADLQADCTDGALDVTASSSDFTAGVVYKVQVGAYRLRDLSKYAGVGNFGVEEDNGVKKYTVGHFREYDEATSFKNYVREMGAKDAWIVVYKDNQRREITEFIEPKND